MGIIKRSIISLTKRKGRTLILLLVIFMIGNVIAGAVAVFNASKQVEGAMKKELGAKVAIQMDYSKMTSNSSTATLSASEADKIGELPEVASVSYELTSMVGSEYKKYSFDGFDMSFNDDMYIDHQLRGSNNATPSHFENGKKQLSEGHFPTQADASEDTEGIVVSKEFAELNNLKIGDALTLKQGLMPPYLEGASMSTPPKVDKVVDVKFVITGLFSSKPMDEDSADFGQKFTEIEEKNAMYTTTTAVKKIEDRAIDHQIEKGSPYTREQISIPVAPIYTLKDVDDIDSFVDKAKGMLEADKFKFQTSKDSYDSVASSITNMKTLSRNVMIFGTIGAIVIMLLVLTLFLRDRKNELGIYNSLGESRIRTISQVLIEVLAVSIIAVSLALFSGSYLAKQMGNSMIENSISQKQSNMMDSNGMILNTGMNDASLPEVDASEIKDNYKVEITQEYIISFYALMFGSAIVATLGSSIYILRLKPREILL